MSQLLSLVAGRNQDTMTFKQAMKESNADQFQIACTKELEDHAQRNHWSLHPSKPSTTARSLPHPKRVDDEEEAYSRHRRPTKA